jgi:hypothetical protein
MKYKGQFYPVAKVSANVALKSQEKKTVNVVNITDKATSAELRKEN